MTGVQTCALPISTIDYILGGHISKLQVMDIGVIKSFKDYIRQAYENIKIGSLKIEMLRERPCSNELRLVGKR